MGFQKLAFLPKVGALEELGGPTKNKMGGGKNSPDRLDKLAGQSVITRSQLGGWNPEVGFFATFVVSAADLLGGQRPRPVEIPSFRMRSAYFSGQGIQELLPLVLTH